MLTTAKSFRNLCLAACCLVACAGGEGDGSIPGAGGGGASSAGGPPSAVSGSGGAGAGAGPSSTSGAGGQSVAGGSQGGAPSAGAGGVSGGSGGAEAGGGAGGTAGAAGAGGAAGSAGTSGSGGGGGMSPLPPITDYKAMGPFATTVEKGVGPSNAYTVFRPSMLGKDGFVHAPIVFGPGIGQEVSVHTTMLTNFASHGFVVVGTPKLNQGPGGDANLKSMKDGLEWILQQNTADGPYKGRLAVDRAIAMGFSVGGTSAVQLGGHAAIATVVSIHGHTATAELHGPMLQTTGTQDTVGMPLQKATYDSSKVQTFLATLTGAPHGYIEKDGGGEERPAILAWLRYFIYADAGAKSFFYGADCKLCKAPWENPQRKNWPAE